MSAGTGDGFSEGWCGKNSRCVKASRDRAVQKGTIADTRPCAVHVSGAWGELQ